MVTGLPESAKMIEVGPEIGDTPIEHTVTLTGWFEGASELTVSTNFTLNMVTIFGTIADQTYRISDNGLTKTVSYDKAITSAGTFTFSDVAFGFDQESGTESEVSSVCNRVKFHLG